MEEVFKYILSNAIWIPVWRIVCAIIAALSLFSCQKLLKRTENISENPKEIKKKINQCEGFCNVFLGIYIPLIFFLFSCAVSDNNIYVRAFVSLVRVAGLIGITGILICLQIRLYRYKSALIEKEK